jgi:hypothetical protein
MAGTSKANPGKLIFGAYSVTVSQQVTAGLGKHVTRLSDKDVAKYEKASMDMRVLVAGPLTLKKTQYVSYFLYLATISLANATGVVFGLMLEPSPTHLRLLQGLMGWNFLWFV